MGCGGATSVVSEVPGSSPDGYNTFGVWRIGFTTGAGTTGASSEVYKTEGAAMPTVGNATFTGQLVGVYIDAGGSGSFVESLVSIDANFADRTLDFQTSSTNLLSTNTGLRTPSTQLDLMGMFAYDPGENAFSGVVEAPVAGLTGTGVGALFTDLMPKRLGGTFNTKGGGVEFFNGSFGAGR